MMTCGKLWNQRTSSSLQYLLKCMVIQRYTVLPFVRWLRSFPVHFKSTVSLYSVQLLLVSALYMLVRCKEEGFKRRFKGHKGRLMQQRMSAMLTALFSANKELPILFKATTVFQTVQQRLWCCWHIHPATKVSLCKSANAFCGPMSRLCGHTSWPTYALSY